MSAHVPVDDTERPSSISEIPVSDNSPGVATRVRRRSVPIIVVVLLAAALLLRLPGITEPSVEQRETQSALLARSLNLGDGAGLSAWKQRVLRGVRETIRPIEPPILDLATAASWRLTGNEGFWFPRLISVLSWLVGGVFLTLIAVRVTRGEGAVTALALYLFWPYAVWHSRLFMPDALLISVLLCAALSVIRYWENPSPRRLIVAGVVSSAAVAVKPGVSLLFLVALFLALARSSARLRASLLRGWLLVYVGLALTLSSAYYLYGTRVDDFISAGASTRRVTPDQLLAAGFWRGWWDVVSYLLRFPQPQPYLALVPLALGGAGVLFVRRGVPRAIVGGLVVGYVAFALAFANYSSTHPYYSLPLIPILSLSIGALVGAALDRLEGTGSLGRCTLIAVIVSMVCVAGYKGHAVLIDRQAPARIADYQEIGKLTGHTSRALVVDRQLATPSMYWGWIVGRNWELDYNETLPPWLDKTDFDYLIVIGVDQLETSRGLRMFAQDLPVLSRTSRFAVFDLRPARLPAKPGGRQAGRKVVFFDSEDSSLPRRISLSHTPMVSA